MVEVSDVVRCRSESVRFVDDELRFVVQSFHGAVVNRHAEVVQDVIFVTAHQPSEVSHWRQPRMGCPPEPSVEVALRPARSPVAPEVSEQFLEQVGAVDLEVQSFELAQAQRLLVGQIPRVLQPDVSGLGHQRLVLSALLADLIPSHLVTPP